MKEKNLEEEKSKISSEKKNYEDILTETQENLNLFLKERNDIAGKIDKVLLAEYQKFYRSKGDFGIAAIHDRVCQGCHMKISAQLEKGIRKNEQIIRCENCARILYYQEK
ncbi:hypothetical protein COS91_04905 [Candidatus Desantisbacteria bacterium CG07_land_8_20_14_0_80_39_15]|uniref:C4-type zinc ribbon domain-containing protein n=1 Tax=Candidatus Desantisbacteria bacterium CG07_land_8_20_14_0_80_39_15 TaxID=1974549 RepID=A0A2M6ZG28_9BACT|nr:MAG: hypothetical protein COS91_04905 [Candidatus Desantisbacteria bacterium CG07_land_8_20_14_0_80_39_15]